MIKANGIDPSMSGFASPPVLIRKRKGSVHWCVDYRALNQVTKKDVYPLPLIPAFFDSLTDIQWFSKLDVMFNVEHQNDIDNVFETEGWKSPGMFTLHPVSSPALLMHWRC